MGFWNTTVKLVTGIEPKPRVAVHRRKVTPRDLIRLESRIGSQLFGPVPAGHRREFFYLDNDTWVWYEEWLDNTGKRRELTTRYEVRQNGVLKVQDGQPYSVVEGIELQNLYLAIRLYYERTSREIYKLDPAIRQSIVA
jgi:hypothetical protein